MVELTGYMQREPSHALLVSIDAGICQAVAEAWDATAIAERGGGRYGF
jgi:hypothetical protein